jgi:CheY-like chemotaxis protein
VTQQVIPGVGLGLSVVARYSELLQHTVHCRSELFKGSCFSVVVPLSIAGRRISDRVEVPVVPQYNLQGLLVAYVDDEPQNLLATAALLERWQCPMIGLDSIAAARVYAAQASDNVQVIPDVLLMDYQLDQANITGLALAAELVDTWEKCRGKDVKTVPVCIISAATEVDLPDRVMEAGFQFLRKPVKPGRLRALLTQLKERRDLQRED